MVKKVVDLSEHRRKKNPRRLEQVVDMAVQRYFDPSVLAETTEPLHFAEGKVALDGGFVDTPDAADKFEDESETDNNGK